MLGGLYEDRNAYAMFKERLEEIFNLNSDSITRHNKPSLGVVLGAIKYVCNIMPVNPLASQKEPIDPENDLTMSKMMNISVRPNYQAPKPNYTKIISSYYGY